MAVFRNTSRCFLMLWLFSWASPSFADEQPNWISKPPKEDTTFKYYTGRSVPTANGADAFKAAYQDAVESAIRENFGFKIQINKESYESIDQANTTQRIQELSKSIEIRGFELQDQYFHETSEKKIEAWALFRYSRQEIGKEKTRLEKQTEDSGLAQFSSIGEGDNSNTGTLSVGTRPSGAAIFIDNEPYGRSNAKIHGVAVGQHQLRIEHSNFEPIEETVIITPGSETSAIKTLQLAKGSLTVHSEPSGAVITLNGKSIGTTPLDGIDVIAGETLYAKAEHPETEPQLQQITVSRNETREINLRLIYKPSFITVNSDPSGAQLSVNGKMLGTTGRLNKLPVTAGQVGIRLEKAGYVSYTDTILVYGGQTKVLSAIHLVPISEEEKQKAKEEEIRKNPPWSFEVDIIKSEFGSGKVDFSFLVVGIERRFGSIIGARLGVGLLGISADTNCLNSQPGGESTSNSKCMRYYGSGNVSVPFYLLRTDKNGTLNTLALVPGLETLRGGDQDNIGIFSIEYGGKLLFRLGVGDSLDTGKISGQFAFGFRL